MVPHATCVCKLHNRLNKREGPKLELVLVAGREGAGAGQVLGRSEKIMRAAGTRQIGVMDRSA